MPLQSLRDYDRNNTKEHPICFLRKRNPTTNPSNRQGLMALLRKALCIVLYLSISKRQSVCI